MRRQKGLKLVVYKFSPAKLSEPVNTQKTHINIIKEMRPLRET